MSLPVLNQRFRNWWQPRRGLAIAEACVIGLVAALSAVFLKVGSGWLGTWRVHSTHIFPVWLALPIIGLVLGFVAGWLVDRLAPEAYGSGIPQVKATLANVPMTLSWRVAGVKLLSAIIAIGSGMTLGRQGPTVQVGAGLAAGMSRWVPTSPDHRRQMIAAGAGAGLAAAFNAPIAGVLFIVEELLQDLSGLTLGTAIIASFIGGVISRLLGGGSLALNLQLTQSSSQFSIPEIPFFLLLGILAGLLGALFDRGLIFSIKFYRKRAEADHLNCDNRTPKLRPEPSYIVYQTRSPSIGSGRLLVPVANPETAGILLKMAAAIARDRHYEIDCVQVMLIPRHSSPSETQVRTAKSRRLLRQAEVLAKKWKIPLHTQIRVTHDVAQAILETINEQHIDLILMGWKGTTSTPGRIFGNVVDTVIRQATCEVVLVKLGTTGHSFNRWLVPMAGEKKL